MEEGTFHHNNCQAHRIMLQSSIEMIKCVGYQGVVRDALIISHAERITCVRA